MPVTLILLATQAAHADNPLGALQNVDSILSKDLANSMIMAVGLGMDHHPYEPATPLGTALGFDFGIEVTLAKPPDSLGPALSSTLSTLSGSGGSGSDLSIISQLALPSVKAHISKGIGPNIDIGLSALPAIASLPYIGGTSFYGGDIKYCFFHPDEGPTMSVRLAFDMNVLNLKEFLVNTTTLSPQFLISKKMEFADPYLGAALEYTYGDMQVTVTPPALSTPGVSISQIVVNQTGSGYAANIFGGVSLRIPVVGFRITLEGAYNTSHVSYIGSKIGWSF